MKLISLSEKKVDLNNMTEEQIEEFRKQPVEIIAVLTNKQYQMIKTGAAELEIPSGVKMENKAGSKFLTFACENRDIAEVLEDGLDNSGIDWQEDNSEDFNLTDITGSTQESIVESDREYFT